MRAQPGAAQTQKPLPAVATGEGLSAPWSGRCQSRRTRDASSCLKWVKRPFTLHASPPAREASFAEAPLCNRRLHPSQILNLEFFPKLLSLGLGGTNHPFPELGE